MLNGSGENASKVKALAEATTYPYLMAAQVVDIGARQRRSLP